MNMQNIMGMLDELSAANISAPSSSVHRRAQKVEEWTMTDLFPFFNYRIEF